MNRAVLAGLTIFLLSWALWSCGYRLEGRDTSLPPEIQTIAVPTMGNQTLEAGIENIFTTALVREFNRDRRLRLVRAEEADSILRGSIQDFSISSVTYDEAGLAIEYRVEVTLEVSLRRVDTDEVLWQTAPIREIETYRAVSGVLTNEARKREAVEEIARELAETVHDRIVDRF
jgi:hypothetical protein